MRDAASELSYGFHLLGLSKLAFETFATSDFIECPLMGNAGHIFSIVGYLKLTLGIDQRKPTKSKCDQYCGCSAADGPLIGLLR